MTGATGFIGRSFIIKLLEQGLPVRVAGRNIPSVTNTEYFRYDSLDNETSWEGAFDSVQVVCHIAGLAHGKHYSNFDYDAVNCKGTINLATQAAKAGVKRFIFISSIGVNGVSNIVPFTSFDRANPADEYSMSKFNAEKGLLDVALSQGLEVVIIRPPLVYGPNAPGNFGRLMKLSNLPFPLPLGGIKNKRSFVALENLVSLMLLCLEHPKAANQTFLVSDDSDISTSELIQMMRIVTGRKAFLISVPVRWLKWAAKLVGMSALIDRLCDSLQVDIKHTKETLGWLPPVSVEEGIRRCFTKEDLC